MLYIDICRKAFRQNFSIVVVSLVSGKSLRGIWRGSDFEAGVSHLLMSNGQVVDIPFADIIDAVELTPLELLAALHASKS